MAGILAVGLAEKDAIHPASFEVAEAARRLSATLGVPFSGALLGSPSSAASRSFALAGMAQLIVPALGEKLSLTSIAQATFLTAAILHADATIILAPHCLDALEWLPPVAAQLQGSLLTDCKSIRVESGQVTVVKSVCGGAILAEFAMKRDIKLATLSPGLNSAFTERSESLSTTTLEVEIPSSAVALLEELADQSEAGPALVQARTVVAGGLGVGSRDDWHMIAETAAALGAAVGATRAVVEAGWVSAKHQVGYSGSKVAPDLYLAVGISGAIHHLAGIGQAKNIVAVNKDANAEIFKVARFGIVGDAKTVLPAFLARVRELQA